MEIGQLREKLKSKYLSIGEYFDETFKFLKVVLKEDKKWIIVFLYLVLFQNMTQK